MKKVSFFIFLLFIISINGASTYNQVINKLDSLKSITALICEFLGEKADEYDVSSMLPEMRAEKLYQQVNFLYKALNIPMPDVNLNFKVSCEKGPQRGVPEAAAKGILSTRVPYFFDNETEYVDYLKKNLFNKKSYSGLEEAACLNCLTKVIKNEKENLTEKVMACTCYLPGGWSNKNYIPKADGERTISFRRCEDGKVALSAATRALTLPHNKDVVDLACEKEGTDQCIKDLDLFIGSLKKALIELFSKLMGN